MQYSAASTIFMVNSAQNNKTRKITYNSLLSYSFAVNSIPSQASCEKLGSGKHSGVFWKQFFVKSDD